jgi:glycyl-tRNA synthetase
VLRLHHQLAAFKAAVLPLSRHEKLVPVAKKVAESLRPHFRIDYDDAGAIGRRYRRHDEIGTPHAVTIDFETLEDDAVTVRDRDSMQQERLPIDGLVEYLSKKLT